MSTPEASATVDVVPNGVAFVELRLGGSLTFAATLPPGRWTALLTVVGTPVPNRTMVRMLPFLRHWRTTTTSDGAFAFSGVAPGVYQWVMVSPASTYFTVPVTVTGAPGQVVTLAAPDTLAPLP